MVKQKRGICMADGGITKETPDQLMARMTAKYGAPSAGAYASPQQPVPQTEPPKAPAQQPQGAGKGIIGILSGRKEQIDKATGYANGGVINEQTHPELAGAVTPRNAMQPTSSFGQAPKPAGISAPPNFGDNSMAGLNARLAAMQASNMSGGGVSATASMNNDSQNKMLDSAMGKTEGNDLMSQFRSFMDKNNGSATNETPARPAGIVSGAQIGATNSNPGSSYGSITGANGRSLTLDSGYADGGIAGHVKFEGKGGPREDKIPVKVAGQNIHVSDGEHALIIPAKTAANAQAMEMIKKIIADSNDGRQPDMGGGDANFSDGGNVKKPNDEWSLGKSSVPTIYGNGGLPEPVVQQGITTMRNQMAAPTPGPVAGSNYVGNGPTDPDTNGRNAMAQPSGAVQRGITTMRGQLNQNTLPSENARASAASDDHLRSLYPAGTFAQAAQAPAQNPMAAGQGAFQVAPFGAQPNKLSSLAPASADASFMTGQAQYDATALNRTGVAKPDSSGGGFTQGNTSYNVNPTSQEGITKVTASGKNPLYTNIRPEDAVSGLKNQSIGQPSEENNLGIARHAAANATTKLMIAERDFNNGVPSGGYAPAILGGGGIEADNAEKTARWRQDDLISQAQRGNQAAIAAVINANSEANKAGIMARSEDNKAALLARGQDNQAKIEAAKLAGNPTDNSLKQAQAQGIMAQTDSAQMLAGIQKKALAGDPQAIASYRALTVKGGENLRDSFMAVGGGQEFDSTANVMRNVPQRLIDLRTGQEVGGQAKPQQGPTFASKAELQAAIKAGTIKSGQTVMTPNGPMVVK